MVSAKVAVRPICCSLLLLADFSDLHAEILLYIWTAGCGQGLLPVSSYRITLDILLGETHATTSARILRLPCDDHRRNQAQSVEINDLRAGDMAAFRGCLRRSPARLPIHSPLLELGEPCMSTRNSSENETSRSKPGSRSQSRVLLLCSVFALLTAVFPIARACFRVEVSYNEGWNVYNVATLVRHQIMYPARYGLTTVNYPLLSFAVLAQLHRLTHDYLFTARALSLVGLAGSCILSGVIVRVLGAPRQAAVLTGFYCLALFAADADTYVGTDDPQMFAQIFFLGGLLLYLWRRNNLSAIAGAALLFVIGGSIKLNLVDIPVAVLIDLALIAPRRALWFSLSGLCAAWVSVALNIRFGGPYFVAQVLTPRSWHLSTALINLMVVLGPLVVPLLVSGYMAFLLRKDRRLRIASILLGTSVLFGSFFAGGRGVSINALFSVLLAMAILTGLLWDRFWNSGHDTRCPNENWLNRAALLVRSPIFLFAWLVIPWLLVPAITSGFNRNRWDPIRRLRELPAAEVRFDDEAAILRSLPGPVICESLLRCYFARKPYVLDPFNTTRLIELGKIDPEPIILDLHLHRYAAVQFSGPIQEERNSERFAPAIEAAIEENYRLQFANQDGEIYVPR